MGVGRARTKDHWSCPGRRRTAVVAGVAANSLRSSRRTKADSPSMSTSAGVHRPATSNNTSSGMLWRPWLISSSCRQVPPEAAACRWSWDIRGMADCPLGACQGLHRGVRTPIQRPFQAAGGSFMEARSWTMEVSGTWISPRVGRSRSKVTYSSIEIIAAASSTATMPRPRTLT